MSKHPSADNMAPLRRVVAGQPQHPGVLATLDSTDAGAGRLASALAPRDRSLAPGAAHASTMLNSPNAAINVNLVLRRRTAVSTFTRGPAATPAGLLEQEG